MKRLLCLFAAILLFTGCEKETQPVVSGGSYACPMLCVITDQPGECPVCGMEMAIVENSAAAQSRSIELTQTDIELSEIRTAPAVEAVPHIEIPMFGKVVPDETRTAVISAWADGRIDRLVADSTGMTVQKGSVLAELYSPELIRAQQELIQAIQHKDHRMTALLREKLRRLGINETQIREIEQRDEPFERLNIIAPTTGTVLIKSVTEGDYVKRGQLLYRLTDLSTVWFELQAYESDLLQIKIGQTAIIEPGGIKGTVAFIDPVISPQSRTAGVRVIVENPDGALRPEMLVRANVHVSDKKSAVLIPASAPLITGERAIVYVETAENIFEGRDVKLGPRAGDQIVVESGVAAGETVVVNGAFRIDAAMQISGRPSMMNPTPSEDSPMPDMHHH